MRIPLGFVQRAALEAYVFESIHDDDRPAGISLDGACLVVDEGAAEQARGYIIDASNSAADSGDGQWERALVAVSRAIGRAS